MTDAPSLLSKAAELLEEQGYVSFAEAARTADSDIRELQSELAAARGKALREAIDELDKHPDASGSRYIEALLSPISQATEKT